MNLQQLNYFTVIAKKRSFSRAAEYLHVTQSTLSHSMHELEADLNTSLFFRSGRIMALTPCGEILFQYAESVLAMLNEARSKIRDLTDPESGLISLGYLSSLNDLVAHSIAGYYEQQGRIQSQFRFFSGSTTEIEEALINGMCDLALTTQPENPVFEFCPVANHNMVIIVSDRHPLANYKELHLSHLRNENLITYEKRCQARRYIDQILQNAHISPKIVSETVQDNIIISSVAANFGVAILPKPLGRHDLGIRTIRILDDMPPRTIGLAYRRSKYLSKAVESYAEYITRHTALMDRYLNGDIEAFSLGNAAEQTPAENADK